MLQWPVLLHHELQLNYKYDQALALACVINYDCKYYILHHEGSLKYKCVLALALAIACVINYECKYYILHHE